MLLILMIINMTKGVRGGGVIIDEMAKASGKLKVLAWQSPQSG